MGTRADFYIGFGKDAEWIGSVAWDGYEWATDEDNDIVKSETPEAFRNAVIEMLKTRNDSTFPDQGWPWPWDTSHTTDYAYCFDDGVKIVIFGSLLTGWENDERIFAKEEVFFPDMSEKKNVRFDKGSGVLFIG